MPYYDGNDNFIGNTKEDADRYWANLKEQKYNEKLNDATKKIATMMKVIDKQKKEIKKLKKMVDRWHGNKKI